MSLPVCPNQEQHGEREADRKLNINPDVSLHNEKVEDWRTACLTSIWAALVGGRLRSVHRKTWINSLRSSSLQQAQEKSH